MLMSLGPDVLARLRGEPRLLFFDIDGTLAPLGERPEEARIPERTRATLDVLGAQARTHMVMITGRSVADARRMLPGMHAWVIGNHGCEVSNPDGVIQVHPQVVAHRDAVASAARALAEVSAKVPGTMLEDKTWTLSLHYRLAADDAAEPLGMAAREVAAAHGLRLTEGKKIYELRPSVGADKGTAAVQMAAELGGLSPHAAVLFAGDDVTDEDAFAALRREAPHAVTVRISDVEPSVLRTSAEILAQDPAALADFLELLARSGDGAREQRRG